MTDNEAIRSLTAIRHEHASCAVGRECLTCLAVRHALQAIEDRAALHEIYVKDPDSWDRAEARLRVFFAVERHMKGEP